MTTLRKSSEGVAAPLEPTARNGFAEKLHNEWLAQDAISDFEEWMIEKLWLAAAVSKNLTDKYYEMEAKWMRELLTVSEEIGEARASVDQLCGDLKAIQQDYTNEKKRAENLQEELAEINRVIMERFGELKCSTKDDEGNQLDASDLVCILATRLELSRQNFAKAESRISGLEKEIAALRETK